MEIEILDEQTKRALWDKHFKTNPAATKKIKKSGRNITAIDAYHQIEEATEEWGPMGSWGLKDVKVEVHDQMGVLTGTFFYEHLAFGVVNSIDTYVRPRDGSPRRDGDWGKKLYTDTLTKALSYLGFNADVFFGKFDDARYVAERTKEVSNELFNKCVDMLATKQVEGIIDETQHEELAKRLQTQFEAGDIAGLERAEKYIGGLG